MDEVDRAEMREAIAREEALSHRYPVLKPCGCCHWCQSPTKASSLFCDKDCASDWERDDRMRRISYGIR